MEELIKEAEMLYKRINDIQLSLIRSRINNDGEGNRTAISEMEIAMCNAFLFLKCILERRDYIVDLGEVWHDIKEEPEYGNTISYVTKRNEIGTIDRVDNNRFAWYIEKYALCKWTYLNDLLPKGGE